MRLKQYLKEGKVLKFTNKLYGVEAEVENTGDGWSVTFFDIDSDEVIERRKGYKSKQQAIKYAKEITK